MDNKYICQQCEKEYYEFSEQAEDGNLDFCLQCSHVDPEEYSNLVKQLEK